MNIRGRVFLLDDDELIISMLARALKKAGFETQVQTTAEAAVKNIADWHPDLVLLDICLDENKNGLDILQEIREENLDTQVVMLTGDDTAESAIRAMKLGAADYLTKPFNVEEVILVIQGVIEKAKLKEEVKYLRKTGISSVEQEMVGSSPAMRQLIENSEKLARARAQTILITGESGTGKEVLARHIHNWRYLHEPNPPDYIPFIAVNCTALPDNLIESELFGHTKYAFTDAKTDKKGLFELADGGTILLDEIGDMRLDLQSKLLRIVEERKVRRLGGKVDLPIEVTVIATTNKDLKTAVAKKEFREDLYFRLSTFALHLPPLRERKEDIPLLAQYFLAYFSEKYMRKDMKKFSPEALRAMSAYSWPGNIRELRNVIERCVVLGGEETIAPENLPVEVKGMPFVERRKNLRIILPENGISLDDVEKDLIKQALERAGNNQTKAAKLLNVSYDTLRYQVKKFDLK